MSEAVSALKGASYEGYARVEELGLRGMITLRGDLGAAGVKTAVKKVMGLDVPKAQAVSLGKDHAVAWMSPDELLLMTPYGKAADTLASLTKALGKSHHLAVNVSDARAVFRVSGAGVREVIAKLCPVDMSEDAFQPGQFRRTRMAQVAAAFWMVDAETVEVVCFRSVADYVFGLLKVSAEPGSEVGYFG